MLHVHHYKEIPSLKLMFYLKKSYFAYPKCDKNLYINWFLRIFKLQGK